VSRGTTQPINQLD